MKKKLIALLCILSLCMTSVLPALAQGEKAAESSAPKLESFSLQTKSGNATSDIVLPEELQVTMEFSGSEREIQYALFYNRVDEEGNYLGNKRVDFYEFYIDEDGEQRTDTIQLGTNDAAGIYQLDFIQIGFGPDIINYNYDKETSLLIGEMDNGDAEIAPILYNGELDFSIAEHDNEDDTAPVLTSLKMIMPEEEEPIYESSIIQFEVGFIEDLSGIKKVNLIFRNEESGNGDYFAKEFEKDDYIGTGKVIVDTEYRMADDYQLSQIRLQDYADNERWYDFEYDEDGNLITQEGIDIRDYRYIVLADESGDGGDAEVSPTDAAVFAGTLYPYKVTVNESEVYAGNQVIATLYFKNDGTVPITLNPQSWGIRWFGKNGDEGVYEGSRGTGDDFVVGAGGTAEITIIHDVNPYTYDGKRECQEICYVDSDYSEIVLYMLGNDGYFHGQLNEDISFVYDGAADFTVSGGNYDNEAPEVKKITVETNGTIYTDAKVEISADIVEKGMSGVQTAIVVFMNSETGKGYPVYIIGNSQPGEWVGDIYNTGQTVVIDPGVYKVYDGLVSDYAGNCTFINPEDYADVSFEVTECQHEWSKDYIEYTSPTCEEDGIAYKYCEKCEGYSWRDYKTLPRRHNYKEELTKATLSKNGKIQEVCSACDDVGDETTIYRPDTKEIKLSAEKLSYTGSARKPSVTVKDIKGKVLKEGKNADYTLTYSSGRVKVGRYSVTVNFCGKYDGKKTLYFTVVPKAPTTVTAKLYGYNDIAVSWSKCTGASGYYVYYKKSTSKSYTLLERSGDTSAKKANLTDGAEYYFKIVPYYKSGETRYSSLSYKTANIYTLKKISIPTVKKSGTKVKVSWKNISGETGYQIRQTNVKTGKYTTIPYKTTTGTYKTISATKGKAYKYKVRAYKVVGKTTVYGPWSTSVTYTRK